MSQHILVISVIYSTNGQLKVKTRYVFGLLEFRDIQMVLNKLFVFVKYLTLNRKYFLFPSFEIFFPE